VRLQRRSASVSGAGDFGTENARVSSRSASAAAHECAERSTRDAKAPPVKIAVPTFGSRVSPRFDCAQVILVVTAEGGTVVERHELTAADWTSRERVSRLADLGVSAVICGGIDGWSAGSLCSAGITVYSAVAGEISAALDAWRRGELRASGDPLPDVAVRQSHVGRTNAANLGGSEETGDGRKDQESKGRL
jgi:predicted Fe-Mo cluster-binding NifX family protein